MINKIGLILCLGAVLTSGCAVQEQLTPTGGDRAGGTVTLSYEYGMFQKPVVNEAQAGNAAAQRCAVWGYTGAEPFGGGLETCEAYNGYGSCIRTRVDVTYQCTGSPNSSHN